MGVREQRVTGIITFSLIGLSIFMTNILKHIPASVLYGVFLYMGVSTLSGIELYQRILLLFMPMKYQPDTEYIRNVPISVIHKFTMFQVGCLILLWVIKSIKMTSIAFPLMLVIMIAIRKLMENLFSSKHLEYLDEKMPPINLCNSDKTNTKSKKFLSKDLESQYDQHQTSKSMPQLNSAAGHRKSLSTRSKSSMGKINDNEGHFNSPTTHNISVVEEEDEAITKVFGMPIDERDNPEDLDNDARYRGCCGKCHVKTLSKFIAIFGLIIESVVFTLILLACILFLNAKEKQEKTEKHAGIATSLAGGIVSIFVYLMVLYGLKKEKPWPFLPFVIFKINPRFFQCCA
uniref:Bicarbonate transporter-like transmembrane domain-containing protein n=1 Tax=Acrobeloides nanus TaxID=290746 RepID=A0A914CD87_9BILA